MFVELALTSSSDAADGTAYLWNLHTGSVLGSFKQNISPLQSMALVNNPRNLGSLFLSAQADKGMMHVYNFQKDQVFMKFPLPDKIVCVAVSNRGTYCAGGTESGRIHIWEIATGILHRTFDAHYKKITVLRFSADDTVMFSGSEDAVVHVWMVNSLLDDSQAESPAPHYSWTDHTLSITDIQCGVGRFHGARVVTSSLDHTCKLWDLSTGVLLTTFLFPTKIMALAFDPAERYFLAASGTPAATASTANEADYLIYQALLYRAKHTQQGYTTLEAVDGDSGLEQIGLGGVKRNGARGGDLVFRGHHHPILRLALNFDGSALVSGDSKGHLMVWDVASRQMVRDIKQHKGAISSIHTLFQPADLYSNSTLPEKPKISPITPFKRIPQSRIGEGGPEVNGNNSIADDPQIIIAPSTSGIGRSAVLAQSQEYQLLESVRRGFVSSRTGVTAGSTTTTIETSPGAGSKDYLELQQRYQELEARLASLTTAVSAPAAPVVSPLDVSAALSGLRNDHTDLYPLDKPNQGKNFAYFSEGLIKVIQELAVTERYRYPETLSVEETGKLLSGELLDSVSSDRSLTGNCHEDYLTERSQKIQYWISSARAYAERYSESGYRYSMCRTDDIEHASAVKYLIIKNQISRLLMLANHSYIPLKDLNRFLRSHCYTV
ncbi:Pre-rRNA-processing protein ipi3 [Entomortierella chlamydospora]|nr:Pre-rRNA-processing protein ipi3 [Entomortierella chlamydospora]